PEATGINSSSPLQPELSADDHRRSPEGHVPKASGVGYAPTSSERDTTSGAAQARLSEPLLDSVEIQRHEGAPARTTVAALVQNAIPSARSRATKSNGAIGASWHG